jgi:hypothetical protein
MTTEDDPLKTASTGVALVGELIKAAGENPDTKQAGRELGKATLTLAKAINLALLPLAAVNFGFEKAKVYFADHFSRDIAEKAAHIPAENLVEPKASIAGPALQGLAFSHEESDLKEMYLNLLASAMDDRVSSSAHPAFVEIIKQLTAAEAQLLRSVLGRTGLIPIAELQLRNVEDSAYDALLTHLVNLLGGDGKTPRANSTMPAMITNWIRLGLVEADYTESLVGDDAYSWVELRPEFQSFRVTRETEKKKIGFQKGVLSRTALGEQFARVVGLLS